MVLKVIRHIVLFVCCIFSPGIAAQNEQSKWYWGNNYGFDFVPNPPAIMVNNAMGPSACGSSVSDATGNLLFYTNGAVIYNQFHVVMPNGSGLLSNNVTHQGTLIVKQPGNTNIFYVFTLDLGYPGNGLHYSVVDMSLAGGTGSVTALKNMPLFGPNVYVANKMTAVQTCNGEVWIVIHEALSSIYRAYLLSNTGISNTAITAIGTVHNNAPQNFFGDIRFSPDGKKLAAVFTQEQSIEMYDFNTSTGALSNSLVLTAGNPAANGARGIEFSQDGSKLYATASIGEIYQWDLCAGSPSAIVASRTAFTPTFNVGMTNLLRAPNNKIYISRSTHLQHYLGVINDPNLPGVLCNYQEAGPQYATFTTMVTQNYMLPNFVVTYRPPDFTSTLIACKSFSFSSPFSGTSCAAPRDPILSMSWNFGDPSSGSANTSTLSNETHTFSAPGSYSVYLVLNYSCGSDTIGKTIVVPPPSSLSVSSCPVLCLGNSCTLTASGAQTYTWSTGANSSSIVVSPGNTTVYTVSALSDLCSVSRVNTVTVSLCTGEFENSQDDHHLRVFPIPAKDELFVSCTKDFELGIYDQLCRKVKMVKIQQGTQVLDISELENGIYYLGVEDAADKRREKIVKLK